MKYYDCNEIEKLTNAYLDHDGYIDTIDEGCLGCGTFVLSADGYKYCVVQEVYLNEWSSAHKIRFYNELPKKWEKAIEEANERMYEEERKMYEEM